MWCAGTLRFAGQQASLDMVRPLVLGLAQDQAVVEQGPSRRAEHGLERALDAELAHQALHTEPSAQADAALRLEVDGARSRAAQALVELGESRGVRLAH